MTLRALLLSTAVLLLVPTAAEAKLVVFKSPSSNIFCGYLTEERFLRCDIMAVDTPTPRRPRNCEFDYGRSFGLTQTGRGRLLCVSDAVGDPSAPVLAYGKSRRFGSITCTMRRKSLRCTNRRDHGFDLNRSRRRVF